jgi:hypothetical protein
MSESDRRGTERLLLAVPIRVIAFGTDGGGFTEDTHTVEVNRAGARILLKHRVATGDTVRIINLESLSEADFRVVGPTRLDSGEVAEWGMECAELGRDIWGIEFAAPIAPENRQAGALLLCEGCGRQVLCVLTLMEVEILSSNGNLQRLCDQCGELSSWTYVDVERRPHPPPPAEPTAPPPPVVAVPQPPPGPADPPPRAEEPGGQVEKRAHKRLALKLPVLIRTHKGEQELAKSENISKGGLAVCLGLKLAVGEIVRVVCPYTEGGQDLEQKGEVRRRVTFFAGTRWLYGLRYVP